MANYTESIGLGFAGAIRVFEAKSQTGFLDRPDIDYTESIGIGFGAALRTFNAKDLATQPNRPSVNYSESIGLGFGGAIRSFTAKTPNVGIFGTTTLHVTPQATFVFGRRITVNPNIVISLRPFNATIVAARTSSRVGSTRLTITPRGTAVYTRAGAHNQVTGQTSVVVTPFGFMQYRSRKTQNGSTRITVTPRATMTYIPQPVRNYAINASTTVRVTPQATFTFTDNGINYSVAGSTTLRVTPRGTVQVVRETTYKINGGTRVSIVVQGSVSFSTGEPQDYAIDGSTTVRITPHGTIQLLAGEVRHYEINGSTRVRLTPRATFQVDRAAAIDNDAVSLEVPRARRLRLIRINR